MKALTLSCLAAMSLSVAACDNSFDDKPAAKVEAKAQAVKTAKPPAKAAAAPATSLKVDASASTIGWVGAKVTGKHEGSFKKFVGSADVQGDEVRGFAFQVEMASVDSDDPKLTGHLQSPDFFDVKKFPNAKFKTTKVAAKAAGTSTHEVTGELTLRGVTKTISFPAAVSLSAKSVSGTAEFTINRKDFKIEYPGMKDDLIKDDVLLKLSLVFPRS